MLQENKTEALSSQHLRLECCKPSWTVTKKSKLARNDQVLSKEVPAETGQMSASELMLSGSNGNRTFPAHSTGSKTERCNNLQLKLKQKAKRVAQFHPRTHERVHERLSVLEIIIVINVQWPFRHSSAPCWVNKGWTVQGHTGREGQSDRCSHRTSRGNVRTLAYLMIHEHVRRWWKPGQRGEGEGGYLDNSRSDPLFDYTRPCNLWFMSLSRGFHKSVSELEKKKGRMQKLVNLCSFFNLLGGVAFEHRLNFKDYKRSKRSSSETSDTFG